MFPGDKMEKQLLFKLWSLIEGGSSSGISIALQTFWLLYCAKGPHLLAVGQVAAIGEQIVTGLAWIGGEW
jgi:hypothetical protein